MKLAGCRCRVAAGAVGSRVNPSSARPPLSIGYSTAKLGSCYNNAGTSSSNSSSSSSSSSSSNNPSRRSALVATLGGLLWCANGHQATASPGGRPLPAASTFESVAQSCLAAEALDSASSLLTVLDSCLAVDSPLVCTSDAQAAELPAKLQQLQGASATLRKGLASLAEKAVARGQQGLSGKPLFQVLADPQAGPQQASLAGRVQMLTDRCDAALQAVVQQSSAMLASGAQGTADANQVTALLRELKTARTDLAELLALA